MMTRIRELRLENNLTQHALAKHLGTNQTTLSKIENGTCMPDATMLIDLSRLFHVSTDYILQVSNHRISADSLMEDNIYNLNKYRHLIAVYQKMNHKQQRDCYTFLCSMLGTNDKI